jgi:hypothetical protein
MRYQAKQEQNDEDEKADPGNFGGGKSYHSKTKDTGYQRDYQKDQSIVQHGDSFLFHRLRFCFKASMRQPYSVQLSCRGCKCPVFNIEAG